MRTTYLFVTLFLGAFAGHASADSPEKLETTPEFASVAFCAGESTKEGVNLLCGVHNYHAEETILSFVTPEDLDGSPLFVYMEETELYAKPTEAEWGSRGRLPYYGNTVNPTRSALEFISSQPIFDETGEFDPDLPIGYRIVVSPIPGDLKPGLYVEGEQITTDVAYEQAELSWIQKTY